MEQDPVFVPARQPLSRLTLLFLFIAVPVLLVLTVAAILDISPVEVVRKWLSKERNLDDWLHLAALALYGFVVLPLYWRISTHSRVHTTASGIRYNAGLPGWLTRVAGGRAAWSIPWGDLREAELRPVPQRKTTQLLLKTHTGRSRTLLPGNWKQHPTETVRPVSDIRQMTPAEQMLLQQTNPLLRALLDRGINPVIVPELPKNTPGADLTANRTATLAIVMMCLFGLYAVADALLLEETYVASPPWGYMAGIGVGFALGFGVLLFRDQGELSHAEMIGVALMVGLASGAAAYPGLLRLNILTDSHAPMTVEYVLQEDGLLHAAEPGLPSLKYPLDVAYWRVQKMGSTHSITLRRGGLGFWQFNSEAVREKIRDWYQKRR